MEGNSGEPLGGLGACRRRKIFGLWRKEAAAGWDGASRRSGVLTQRPSPPRDPPKYAAALPAYGKLFLRSSATVAVAAELNLHPQIIISSCLSSRCESTIDDHVAR